MTGLVTIVWLLGLPPLGMDDPKGDPPAQPSPAAKPDDAEKLRAEIARDMEAVERKLKEHDAGRDTRDLQKRILEKIDKLLERAKNPPEDQQPMGGASQKDDASNSQAQPGGQSQPQPGTGGGPSRRQRREAQRRQEQQQARGSQRPGSSSGSRAESGGETGPNDRLPTGRMPVRTGPADSLADIVKDIWGHLPETLRQDVDHYYREQFMPRYRDLLQQYYLRLAETERKLPGGRP